jgi:methionine-rich copper-binding protein CopC
MLRALVLLSAAGLAILALAAPAVAHTELVSSAPADKASAESPTEVRLTFSEPVDPRFAKVSVKAPGGADVTQGKPAVTETVVVQPIAAKKPGKYTVAFRIVSTDGHPVSSSQAFTVTVPAAASPPATEPSPPAAARQQAAPSLTPASSRSNHERPWFFSIAIAALCLAGIGAVVVRTRSVRAADVQRAAGSDLG